MIRQRQRQTGGTAYWERPPYCGHAEQVADELRQLIHAGFDYLIFGVPNASESGAIQRVAEELLPLLRY